MFIVSCLCILFLLSSIGGGYYYYQNKNVSTKPTSISFDNYYCRKDALYCMRTIDDTIAKPPSIPIKSKWLFYNNSCTDCIGRYLYTFGISALSDAILRLKIATSPDDVDAVLETLARSVDQTCANMPKKNRPQSNCMFFVSPNAGEDVDGDALDALYTTLKNSIAKQIPLSVKTSWWTKYKDQMTKANAGNNDPFLVLLWLTIDEEISVKSHFPQIIDVPNLATCSVAPKVTGCST